MYTHRFGTAGLLAVTGFAVASCSANIHDNTVNIPDATINVTTTADVDVNNVTPGQNVPVMLTVEKVFLVEPTMAPPPEHVADAGHVQVYMDDTANPPLLITAQATFNVTVPPQTKGGKHKLICRVHKHDGTPTTTKTEINITVTVSGDGGVSVQVDANTSTTDGATSTGGTSGTGGTTGTGGTSGVGGAGGA